MSDNTGIEWTDTTWNPSTGCDKVSPGCGLPRPGTNDEATGQTGGCYAMTMARRLKAMGQAKYQNDGDPRTSGPGFGVTMHPDTLTAPLSWTKPRKVFVNSMSDLFHDKIDASFIAQVFAVMSLADQHIFQVLTKRHGRMRSLLTSGDFPAVVNDYRQQLRPGAGELTWPIPGVWLGVSAENQQWADIRIPALLDTPAAVRWVSAEPLLGPIDFFGPLDVRGHRPRLTYWLDGRPGWGAEETTSTGLVMQRPTVAPHLDWVVTGGESGPGARPAHPAWFRNIRNQCQQAGVPYLHKQHGAYTWESGGPYRTPDLYVSAETGETVPAHVTPETGRWAGMWRVGKKAAGRELDGREWSEYPS